jgi:hypothetical protein
MALFDFFKPKKTVTQEIWDKMSKQFFPKGSEDINAGTDELLFILHNSIDKETARNIFIKSMIISSLSDKFDEERLRIHLSGYCLEHFTEKQVKDFHLYITLLKGVLPIFGVSPSQVHRKIDGGYFW